MNPILSLQLYFLPQMGDLEKGSAAVVFELAPEWHIYWENPGDMGMSTTIEGADMIVYPTPQIFQSSFNTVSYGYAGKSIFFAVAPKEELEVHWLACKEDPSCTSKSGCSHRKLFNKSVE